MRGMRLVSKMAKRGTQRAISFVKAVWADVREVPDIETEKIGSLPWPKFFKRVQVTVICMIVGYSLLETPSTRNETQRRTSNDEQQSLHSLRCVLYSQSLCVVVRNRRTAL